MSEPKRIILRLSETDFNAFDMYEAVRAYLEHHDRSATELQEYRHRIHMRPSNDHIPQHDPKVYFIVDLEMDLYVGDKRGRVERDFPHELFGVRRGVDGRLLVYIVRLV